MAMRNKKFSIVVKSKIKEFKKTIEVDSDKSISIRSFLIGAISQGISKAQNILESDDVIATISCLKKLGVKINKTGSRKYEIYGKGLGSLHCKKKTILDCQNSGTLSRLLIGILSSTPDIEVIIKGDSSLNKRNMSKLIGLMEQFGAEFTKNKSHFPLKMISSEMPIGITYKAGVSAQLKSAVILAGLNSYGNTNIIEEKRSRNHTENIIQNSKNVLSIKKGKKKIIKVVGKKNLDSININVPADPSSAAFFTALTILNKNSSLIIKNVGLNKTRIGFYELLKKHGAKIFFKNIKKKNNEIVGDILVASSKLKPISASKEYYAKATDEYPIMFVVAALTKGVSTFRGIEDLANKESNRITEMQKILKQAGIKSKYKKNTIKIFGNSQLNNKKKIINVPNLNDHRICMSATILSTVTNINSNIKNFSTVQTSSPNFLKIFKSLGGKFEKKL